MKPSFRVTDDMRSGDRLTVARTYVEAGLKLLVTHGMDDGHCTCRRGDCASPGKHPIAKYFLRPKRGPVSSLGSEPASTIPLGDRNNALFRIARDLRRHLVGDDLILEVMQRVNEIACEKPVPPHELRSLTASSANYAGAEGELFGPPAQTKPLPMEWLWYPYIPRYGLTIIAGDPGQGKSMLVALLIGIVTSGRSLPLSDDHVKGKKVLVLSAEDNWARVTLHRLEKAGAIVDNIHVMHHFRALTDDPSTRWARR